MNWWMFGVGVYLCYYTLRYAIQVWQDQNPWASIVLGGLAMSLVVVPFLIK